MKHTLTNSMLLQHSDAHERTAVTGFDLNVKSMLNRALRQLLLYYHYHRQRQMLLKLTDEQLDDIGLTSEQAEQEGNKAFWKH